jgi:serine/threonine protein kinase
MAGETRRSFPAPEGGEYEVVSLIGYGGVGVVYEVCHTENGYRRAIKMLRASRMDELAYRSFKNELHLATQIVHRNVIKYYSFHESLIDNVPPYIIMEYANGGALSDRLRDRSDGNFFSNDELLDMFRQLIDGMEAINHTLIHRDINPRNILISDGILKVSDFGLAKIVAEATRGITFKGMGTEEYMSPEAWKLEPNTAQMDVYSMGIVFYEIACLRHPLESHTHDENGWRNAHLFQIPQWPHTVNPRLPPSLSSVIMKMIEKRPERRGSWAELRKWIDHEEEPPRPPNTLVTRALTNRLLKDCEEATRKAQWAAIFEAQEIVRSQFRMDIYEPIRDFLQEFNKGYPGKENRIYLAFNGYSFVIVTSSEKAIRCGVRPVLRMPDSTVHLSIANDPNYLVAENTENTIRFEEETPMEHLPLLEPPTYKGRAIMSWGYLAEGLAEDPNQKPYGGSNLLLVAGNDSPYGNWYVVTSTTPCADSSRDDYSSVLEWSGIVEWLLDEHGVTSCNVTPLDLEQVISSFISERI